jgi:DNA-binding CsgD family transcriptional regulator
VESLIVDCTSDDYEEGIRWRSLPMTELALADDIIPRRTGIRLLGEIPWGTHICVFYETKQDLLDTGIAYFKAGLDANEFCVWAVSPPISEQDAGAALRGTVRDFDARKAAGQIEILPGYECYLKGGQFDLKRITAVWSDKLTDALALGYEGMRASGNAFWFEENQWKAFCEYEQEVDRSLAGQKMIAMCTYSLRESRAVDILDVVRAHNLTVARRNGEWQFLETRELKQAKREIKQLNRAIGVLSHAFHGSKLLTPRERIVLAQLVRGATSKEAGRVLGISPRTVEFHRANIMKKLGARNLVELVHKVTSEVA